MLHRNLMVISEQIKYSWVYALIRFVIDCEMKYGFYLAIENMSHFDELKIGTRATFCVTPNLVIQMNAFRSAILSSYL